MGLRYEDRSFCCGEPPVGRLRASSGNVHQLCEHHMKRMREFGWTPVDETPDPEADLWN